MNKKKVSIIVAVISIIFVMLGIILVTRINRNVNTRIASNMNVGNFTNLNKNKSVEDNSQYDMSREYSAKVDSVIDNNVSKEETDYERYLRENDKNTYEEMSEFFEEATDKIVVYVNEEPITEREIALKDFSLNNKYIKNYTNLNLNEEESDPVKAIIQDVVICQEAKKMGYSVTEEDINQVKSVPNYKESMKKMAQSANMSQNEFEDVYIKSEIRTNLLGDWIMGIVDKIHNGDVNIDSREFSEKYEEYINIIEDAKHDGDNVDLKRAMTLSIDMLKLYKKYLVEQADIEYVK